MLREEFLKGWSHFCKHINFSNSNLDSDSIKWMNEFEKNIDSMFSEDEVKIIVKNVISRYGFDDQIDNALKVIDEIKVK